MTSHRRRPNLKLVRENKPNASKWALYPPDTAEATIEGGKMPPLASGVARWSHSRQAYDAPTSNDYGTAWMRLKGGWPLADWKGPVEA